MELTELPNIGHVLANNLKQTGINSAEDLRAVGACEAWLRIRAQADSRACFHQRTALRKELYVVIGGLLRLLIKADAFKEAAEPCGLELIDRDDAFLEFLPASVVGSMVPIEVVFAYFKSQDRE